MEGQNFSQNAGATRLKRVSRQMPTSRHPYYLHTPRPATSEPAPGWYWMPEGASHPQYLGHNSYEAEFALRTKLAQRQAAAAAELPEAVAA